MNKYYNLPKFKELDTVGKGIYMLSFIIPIGVILTFIYLYFLPLGLDETYTIKDREISFTNTRNIYTIEDEDVLDGVVNVEISPRFGRRNVFTKIELEGEHLHIIEPRISNEDIMDVYEDVFEFETDFEYKILDDYEVKQNDFISFKLELEIDWEDENRGDDQMVLKYQNLRVIAHEQSIEARIDKAREDDQLRTYRANYSFHIEDRRNPVVIYVNYKKPNETNGYLELYVNNRLGDRVSIYSVDKEYENKPLITELKTIWHEELIKDLNQEHISLKQEKYTIDFKKEVPEGKEILEYYEKLHKPDWYIDEENGEEIDTDKIFIYDEEIDNKRYQSYYNKTFFNNFEGRILKVDIGYEYPFVKKKKLEKLFSETPINIKVAGENSKIENINVNLFREPIWEKL